MIIKNEDILKAKEEAILQQCNCLTVRAHGLAQTLADNWEWADVYSHRRQIGRRNLAIEEDRSEPGTIYVAQSDDVSDDPDVICAFAQWCPGKPLKYTGYPDWHIDTTQNREKWFKECLDAINDLGTYSSIAIPWRIGCGLAGGNWTTYRRMIEEFERESGIKVVCYKVD